MKKEELIKLLEDLDIKEIKEILITYIYEKGYGYNDDKTRTIKIGDE